MGRPLAIRVIQEAEVEDAADNERGGPPAKGGPRVPIRRALARPSVGGRKQGRGMASSARLPRPRRDSRAWGRSSGHVGPDARLWGPRRAATCAGRTWCRRTSSTCRTRRRGPGGTLWRGCPTRAPTRRQVPRVATGGRCPRGAPTAGCSRRTPTAPTASSGTRRTTANGTRSRRRRTRRWTSSSGSRTS